MFFRRDDPEVDSKSYYRLNDVNSWIYITTEKYWRQNNFTEIFYYILKNDYVSVQWVWLYELWQYLLIIGICEQNV